MNFEIGDKVNFICRGEICTGAILDFGKKAILVEYTTGDRAVGDCGYENQNWHW